MDDATEDRPERMRSERQSKTGRRVTRQGVLERLVERAVESKSDLVDPVRERRVPIDEDERDDFHEGKVASGTPTREEDIDDELYG